MVIDVDKLLVTGAMISAFLLSANLLGVIEMDVLTALGPFILVSTVQLLLVLFVMRREEND